MPRPRDNLSTFLYSHNQSTTNTSLRIFLTNASFSPLGIVGPVLIGAFEYLALAFLVLCIVSSYHRTPI